MKDGMGKRKGKKGRKSSLSGGEGGHVMLGWEEGRNGRVQTMHMPAHAGPAPTWTLITSK
jgi:hypothetical protein